MCLIIACEKQAPTIELLRKAEAQNNQGGGIAYRTKTGVRYAKDLTANQINTIITGIKLPYIVHFRIASSGPVDPLLCHPFPVEPDAPLKLEGDSHMVLAHNGTWMHWRETLIRLWPASKAMPVGPWNDTRAMASLTAMYGEGFLEILGEKVAVLSKNSFSVYGSGWHWSEKDQIWMSYNPYQPLTTWNGQYAGYSTYGNHAHDWDNYEDTPLYESKAAKETKLLTTIAKRNGAKAKKV